MATLYTQQDKNIRKTWMLMVSFLVVVIGIAWVFSVFLGNPLILYIAVVFAVGMNIMSYWNSDKIVLKMTGAKAVKRDEHRELWNIVENLSITAGLPMPKLYIMDDPAPNAFATGRDKEHAVVAVTTGLLGMLSRSELEGVIAHELSHIGNRDMLVSTVAVVLVGFVVLLSDFFLRATLWGGAARDRDGRIQVAMIIAGVVLALLAPLVATAIQLAVSRKREFLADASGALLTRYPEGLAGALKKISGYRAPMRRANHATAHLFLANPFGSKGQKKIGLMNKMFMTHPPTEERVAALMNKKH